MTRQGVSFRPFRNIFGHEEVAYGDAPIELAKVGGAREFSQFVVFDCFFPVMRRFSLRPAYWVLHNPLPTRIPCDHSFHRFGRPNVMGLRYPRFSNVDPEFSPLSPIGVLRRVSRQRAAGAGDCALRPAGCRWLGRSPQPSRGSERHAVGHGLYFFRLVIARAAVPSAMVNERARRQEAEISVDQATIGIPAPRRGEDDLDIGFGNIDVEIGLDRMPDHWRCFRVRSGHLATASCCDHGTATRRL